MPTRNSSSRLDPQEKLVSKVLPVPLESPDLQVHQVRSEMLVSQVRWGREVLLDQWVNSDLKVNLVDTVRRVHAALWVPWVCPATQVPKDPLGCVERWANRATLVQKERLEIKVEGAPLDLWGQKEPLACAGQLVNLDLVVFLDLKGQEV